MDKIAIFYYLSFLTFNFLICKLKIKKANFEGYCEHENYDDLFKEHNTQHMVRILITNIIEDLLCARYSVKFFVYINVFDSHNYLMVDVDIIIPFYR